MKLYTTPYGKFWLYEKDWMQQQIAGGYFWDDKLRPIFDKYAPGAVCVDIGANCGFYSIYMASLGARRVYAYEPQWGFFKQLVMNVDENQFGDRIFPINAAVWAWDTMVEVSDHQHPGVDVKELLDPESSTLLSGLALKPCDIELSPGIPSVAFPALTPLQSEQVNFFKIDAQGADLTILNKLLSYHKLYHPVVLFEYEEDLSRSVSNLTLSDFRTTIEVGGFGTLDQVTERDWLFIPKGSE